MLWMIDNYDSFTFNLVQYLGEIGQPVQVVKNDELTVAELLARHVAGIVISPGPGNPDDSGISLEVIRAFAPSKPILGVCLGHQAIGQVFGARVVHARKVMHGKTCDIYHDGTGIFRNLPSPLKVTRYHSLVIDSASLPEDLQVTAYTRTADGTPDEIMAIRHVRHRIEGVQFHPEAILTEHGHSLLRNFCDQLGA